MPLEIGDPAPGCEAKTNESRVRMDALLGHVADGFAGDHGSGAKGRSPAARTVQNGTSRRDALSPRVRLLAAGWHLPRAAAAVRRALKHPRLMHYHRLVALVVLVNVGLLARHLSRGDWHVADGARSQVSRTWSS